MNDAQLLTPMRAGQRTEFQRPEPNVFETLVPAPLPQLHLAAHRVTKSYVKAQVAIPVLRGVDLQVRRGEFVAIIGQSGSGKSTLLHVLATLDRPDSGEIHFDGHRIDNVPAAGRDTLRNKYLGMIFQFYHLLPELTTLENVLMPTMIASSAWKFLLNKRRHQQAAREMLAMVGLGHRLKHKPRELSGGEMQRAAIARALIAQPEVLLADEPTGNLDPGTSEQVFGVLMELVRATGLSALIATHNLELAARMDRVVRLTAGRVE
jgi:lipoprotein-releasing system ATP-binding protein